MHKCLTRLREVKKKRDSYFVLVVKHSDSPSSQPNFSVETTSDPAKMDAVVKVSNLTQLFHQKLIFDNLCKTVKAAVFGRVCSVESIPKNFTIPHSEK